MGKEIQSRSKDRPKESILPDWYTSSFEKIVRRKDYAMGLNGFKVVLNGFPQDFGCIKVLFVSILCAILYFQLCGVLEEYFVEVEEHASFQVTLWERNNEICPENVRCQQKPHLI